jgi:hypothetical protein
MPGCGLTGIRRLRDQCVPDWCNLLRIMLFYIYIHVWSGKSLFCCFLGVVVLIVFIILHVRDLNIETLNNERKDRGREGDADGHEQLVDGVGDRKCRSRRGSALEDQKTSRYWTLESKNLDGISILQRTCVCSKPIQTRTLSTSTPAEMRK